MNNQDEFKWYNKGILIKTIACECDAESDVLLKFKEHVFKCFDSTDSWLKDNSKVLVSLGSLDKGGIKHTEKRKKEIVFEEIEDYKVIKEASGEVVEIIDNGEINGNTVIVNIGGIYVQAIDRNEKKAKKRDFVSLGRVNYVWDISIDK